MLQDVKKEVQEESKENLVDGAKAKLEEVKQNLEERKLEKAESISKQRSRLQNEKYIEALNNIKEVNKSSSKKMAFYGLASIVFPFIAQFFLMELNTDAFKRLAVFFVSTALSLGLFWFGATSENSSSNKQTLNDTYDNFKFDLLDRDNKIDLLTKKVEELEKSNVSLVDSKDKLTKLEIENEIRDRVASELEKGKSNEKINNNDKLDYEGD